VSRRALFVEAEVHRSRKRLPGHLRQRIKRAIDGLAEDPRPAESRALDVTGMDVPSGVGVLRLRVGGWRIVYAVNEGQNWIWVLAIRKRPPYGYEDLADLVSSLPL
jgi:mRNA interferase RelE/StbE